MKPRRNPAETLPKPQRCAPATTTPPVSGKHQTGTRIIAPSMTAKGPAIHIRVPQESKQRQDASEYPPPPAARREAMPPFPSLPDHHATAPTTGPSPLRKRLRRRRRRGSTRSKKRRRARTARAVSSLALGPARPGRDSHTRGLQQGPRAHVPVT